MVFSHQSFPFRTTFFPSRRDSFQCSFHVSNLIAKALWKYRLGCTTPSFWKWPDARYILTSDTTIYQAKLRSGHNLVAHAISKEIGACLLLLWVSTWCLYLKWIPNGCRYMNCFIPFVPLMSMEFLLVQHPSLRTNYPRSNGCFRSLFV